MRGKMEIKIYYEHVDNIGEFLKNTIADVITIRTTYLKHTWWDDMDLINTARKHGFSTTRFTNPELLEKGEFAECYHFTRFI